MEMYGFMVDEIKLTSVEIGMKMMLKRGGLIHSSLYGRGALAQMASADVYHVTLKDLDRLRHSVQAPIIVRR